MALPGPKVPGARQTAWILNDIRTEVTVIPYADRTFVIATQLNKLGNLEFTWPTEAEFCFSALEDNERAPEMANNLLGIHGTNIIYTEVRHHIVSQLVQGEIAISTKVMATCDSDGGGGAIPGGRGRRYNVQVLLGRRDDPLLCLYARQLLEQMKSDKPLLLAICLKEEGRDTRTFQEVINQVLALGGWDG